MKRCPGCGNDYPVEAFGVKTRNPDGSVKLRQAVCAICRAEERQAFRRRREQRKLAACPVDREPLMWLDAAPWRAWLARELGSVQDAAVLADRLGVAERQLYRWLYEAGRVGLDNVDAALCAADRPGVLYELYPALACEQVAA
jgi:hypothetical protein